MSEMGLSVFADLTPHVRYEVRTSTVVPWQPTVVVSLSEPHGGESIRLVGRDLAELDRLVHAVQQAREQLAEVVASALPAPSETPPPRPPGPSGSASTPNGSTGLPVASCGSEGVAA